MIGKKRILWLFFLLVFIIIPLVSIEYKILEFSPQMQEFIDKIGSGEYTLSEDSRLFSKINCKFDLPVPQDSIALCNNTDFIAGQLEAIYKHFGASYSLKRVSFNKYSQSCQYLQFWKNFYLEKQPFFLLITYHPDTDTYSVFNTLYTGEIIIPDQVIDLNSAIAIDDFISDRNVDNTDLDSIKLTFAETDTLPSVFRFDMSENGDYYKQFSLNLYPVGQDDISSGFLLQWLIKRPLYEYIPEPFFLTAETGALRTDALQYWTKRKKQIIAAADFLSQIGLKGKIKPSITGRDITFYGIKLTSVLKDSVSFKTLTDTLVPKLLEMNKKIGYDLPVEYVKTREEGRDSATKKLYNMTIRYKYKFKYPIYLYASSVRLGISFIYHVYDYQEYNHTMSIEVTYYDKPIQYPKKIITPATAVGLYNLHKSCGWDNRKYTLLSEEYPKKYIDAEIYDAYNDYVDREQRIFARLCLRPVFDEVWGETLEDLKPVWYVREYTSESELLMDNPDYHYDDYRKGRIYDPVSGRLTHNRDENSYYCPDSQDLAILDGARKELSEVFAPLGSIHNCEFVDKSVIRFDCFCFLPAPKDSVCFLDNANLILSYLMQYYNTTSQDYSYKLVKDEYDEYTNYKIISLYYKGF
ncbi:MAG: hypothetical protein R6V77_02655, partial [Candidatus Cloacimonadaceae bacterium]